MATELKQIQPGLYPRMSRAEYERLPGINFSSLKHLSRTPAHFRAEMIAPKESTKAQEFGSALHVLCLEESRFESEYVRGLDVGRRSNADKAAWSDFQAQNVGRTVLTGDEFDQLYAMRDALFQNDTAKELLSCQGMNEVSAVWVDVDSEITCKGRIDRICQLYGHTFIIDLKSAVDAGKWAFQRDIVKYKYALQAAWYSDGLRSISDYERRFLHIVCEKDAPHCAAVYELDAGALAVGRKMAREYLALYKSCLESGIWEGYKNGIHEISLPKWASQGEDL